MTLYIKGKQCTKDSFLRKHQWHQHLKKVRAREDLRGRPQKIILSIAKESYTPPACSKCHRKFEQEPTE